MTKKEYVLKVLDKVLPYWEEAKFIKEQILLPNASDEYIDNIYQKCVISVDKTLKQQNINKSQQLGLYLQSLQVKERISQEADQKDIEKLETLLNNF